MKQIHLSWLLMAAAVITACEKERVETEPTVEKTSYVYSVKATISSDAETRTDYDADGKFSWSSGDQISVLFNDGETNKFFTLTTEAGGETATFTGTIDAGYTIGATDKTDEDLKIWALYPASENHSYTEGANPSFYVQPEVDFTETHFSANIPMYDQLTEQGTFSFKNLASTYKFTVKDLDSRVKKVKFQIYNQTTYALSGLWPIHADKYINYDYASPGSEKSTLTYVGNVTNGQAVFYVSSRYYGKFQPVIKVFDADHDFLLKEFTAGTEKIPSSMSKVQRISLSVPTELPVTIVDGVIEEWDEVPAIAGNTTRILEWKYLSDESNLYFLFKIDKAMIVASNWGSYIFTGFDTDNDSTTGTNAGADVNGGFEAMCSVYPWRVNGEGGLDCLKGQDNQGTIACPVGTELGKVTVAGSFDSDYCYVETSVPLSMIGSPNGDITVKHGMNYYVTSEAVITVGAAALQPKEATISAEDVSVKVGKTVNIGATTNSSAAIEYVSGDSSIATVTSDGTVEGVAAGSTTITLSVPAVEGKFTEASKTINVTVNAGGIDIDGDMSDWDDCETVYTNDSNNYRAFKAAYDKDYIYLYTKRVTVDGQRYIYYDFDLDNDPTTGTSEGDGGTRTGLEAYMALVLYSGNSIVENPGADSYYPNASVYSGVVCKGTVGSDFTETELSIPRSNLNIKNGDTIKIYSWGNKSADGVASHPLTLTITN